MPSLDIYTDILAKWEEILTGDARIGGREIKVIYTRVEPSEVDMNLMPYVAYFLERNWQDDAIGSGSYSPQSRIVTVRMGFLLCMMEADAGKLDKSLFLIGGDLLDILRERRHFDSTKSIVVGDKIVWDFDTLGVETGQQIGTQHVSFSLNQFANFG